MWLIVSILGTKIINYSSNCEEIYYALEDQFAATKANVKLVVEDV